MSASEIVNEIVECGYVEGVFKILSGILIEQKNNYRHSRDEYRACLRAIHKINNGKNEGIDALSEV